MEYGLGDLKDRMKRSSTCLTGVQNKKRNDKRVHFENISVLIIKIFHN